MAKPTGIPLDISYLPHRQIIRAATELRLMITEASPETTSVLKERMGKLTYERTLKALDALIASKEYKRK